MCSIDARRGRYRYGRLPKDVSGSFTLEASLVFPYILIATFLLLFFAIFIAQQAIAYYSASVAGERAAANWANSAKELRTGAYPEGNYDGLYWRLGNDGLLAGLFGIETTGASSFEFGLAEDGDPGSDLVARKLSAASEPIDTSLSGELTYENEWVVRRIRVDAASSAVPDPLRQFRGFSSFSVEPSAVVVEPAEFIRTFDLVRYYGSKMKNAKEGESSFIAKAKSVLKGRQPST